MGRISSGEERKGTVPMAHKAVDYGEAGVRRGGGGRRHLRSRRVAHSENLNFNQSIKLIYYKQVKNAIELDK